MLLLNLIAFVMELVDILVLGTSAERRAGSNPAEGIFIGVTSKKL
jgi:hypothetical protein